MKTEKEIEEAIKVLRELSDESETDESVITTLEWVIQVKEVTVK